MSADIVLRAENLGKAYRVWRRPEDRLKQLLLPRRRYYEEYWALREFNLEARAREAIGVVGRNGAGKSTFLQLACGTLDPSCGVIEKRGRVAALLELGAGFNPEFTGRENVMLSAMVMGLSASETKDRFADIAEFAGIGDFVDMPVRTYSSGMYARLAFAVAAHVDADILIVDEILAVGDIGFAQKCMRFIREFREHGTLLFVSHSTDAVLNLCDRAVWLDKGRMVQCGPAKEVCRDYVAAIEREKDNASSFRIGARNDNRANLGANDHRAPIFEAEGLGGNARIFAFDPNAAWYGRRGASITNVRALNGEGSPALLPSGGDEIVLEICGEAHRAVFRPIVGFSVCDHLGQAIFGDNTYLTYRDNPFDLALGERFIARFRFKLPYLPNGDYMVSAAIAEGSEDEHVQHHWLHDALILKVSRSHIRHGLVGIPMLDIQLAKEGAETLDLAVQEARPHP